MRIVAGRLGGRTLVAPRGRDTRPTSERVREALFSILGDLAGARVLDAWAGTGALGLEALSRGAARAVFVEHARPALAALRANVAALGVGDDAVVLATPIERSARAIADRGPFDLVLADPPWADVRDGAAARALDAIIEAGALAADARVVLEHAKGDDAPPLARLERTDARTYGDTALAVYVTAR